MGGSRQPAAPVRPRAAGDRLLMDPARPMGRGRRDRVDHFDKDMHDLVAKGKSQGYLTYDEVTRVLPDDEVDPDKPLTSTDIYLIAAHREKRSNQFYTELAGMHSDPEVKNMLRKMASEELKHKEKMEYLYSNTAFAQTAGG